MSGVRLRIFFTCWLVYLLHFATDFSREHYLVVSIAEDRSYALDKYFGLHVDIFKNPPNAPVQGAHHGANPGISMVAAIPYALSLPVVNWVVGRELASRRARGDTGIAEYRDNRPHRVAFYKEARARGLDVRFGLVEAITLAFCMAPLSALSVVVMFQLLGAIGLSQRRAIWLSLLYGLGTPVLFRTAYLNQNLAVGVFGFIGFALLWNPKSIFRWRPRTRLLVAGGLGGLAVLSDYSGAILAGTLGLYAWWRRAEERGWAGGFRDALWYALGVVPGVLLLWHYQYAAFGNPFYPPQHWMAPVRWIDVGYQGVGGITPELLGMLLFDSRFGLFVAMPLAVLAVAAPWLARRQRSPLPFRESVACLAMIAAMVLFFSTVQYTRLQYVTGIRYLAAIFPMAFLASVPLFLRLPRILAAALAGASVMVAWSMAMVRSQGTVLDNVKHVAIEGFQLPWLTVLAKTSAQYLPWLDGRPSPLPWFLVFGLAIWGIWAVRRPWERVGTRDG